MNGLLRPRDSYYIDELRSTFLVSLQGMDPIPGLSSRAQKRIPACIESYVLTIDDTS